MRLHAVGDVLIDRSDPASAFRGVRDVLGTADLLFGNCEGVYSDAETFSRTAGAVHRSAPRNAAALGEIGFDVMSFANNHALDLGVEGLRDTLAALAAQGIATVGAGDSLAEAIRPATVRTQDVAVAFITFTCVYPPGTEARDERPGSATLRVHTLFEQREIGQPGTSPAIITFVDDADVALVNRCVAEARNHADVVVFTPHWGVHLAPAVVADYERSLARTAIDAGADIVIGHHQHILKGIDTYRGRAIFHGVGNFVFDVSDLEHLASARVLRTMRSYGEYAVRSYLEWPTYPFHPESRMTIVVGVIAGNEGVQEVGFAPCLIDRDGAPVLQPAGSQGSADVVAYLEKISADAELTARLTHSAYLGQDWIRVETACA